MEWSKLKNIVLLLLLTTNLCLLGFLVHQDWKSSSQLREAREQAIVFLKQKEIAVDPQVIPVKMELQPYRVERSTEAEQTAAAGLLGENVTREERGGEVYRYANENGSVQFHSDGAFSAEFSTGFAPLGENSEESGRALLEKLGFRGVLVRREGENMVFRENWEGIPVFNQEVTLVCREGEIRALAAGRRLTGTPVEDSSRSPVSVPTAIFEFYNGLGAIGDVCSRIDRIDRGYVSTASLTGPMTLTPVWRVETETGSYQLDTLTGALIRLN